MLDKVDNYLVAIPQLMIITKTVKWGLRGITIFGDTVSDFFTGRSYKNAVDDIANLISAATKKYIEDFANEQIFAPLEISLNDELDSANDVLRLKKENIDSVNALKEQLRNDIWDLELEVAGK